MDDVGVEGAQLAAHLRQPIGEDADVGDRTVGAEGLRPRDPDYVIRQLEALRIATVKRPAEEVRGIGWSKHAKLVAASKKLAGECIDVPVDAPGIGPRVRRDDRYAHPPMVATHS